MMRTFSQNFRNFCAQEAIFSSGTKELSRYFWENSQKMLVHKGDIFGVDQCDVIIIIFFNVQRKHL